MLLRCLTHCLRVVYFLDLAQPRITLCNLRAQVMQAPRGAQPVALASVQAHEMRHAKAKRLKAHVAIGQRRAMSLMYE